MILFNETNNEVGVEKNLNKKIVGGEIALKTNERINSNKLVLLTIETLEYLKRAYQEGKKEVYKDYVINDRFNESVQNLIYNSPPIINPHFLNIPIEEIPNEVIKHYSKLMNMKDKESYYEIDARSVITKHFNNEERLNFYSTKRENPYSLGNSYKVSNRVIPTSVIYESVVAARNLATKDNSYYGIEDMMTQKIIIPKENFKFEHFMYLYELFYFDLFMNTFYKDYLNIVDKFKNIQFVPKNTNNSYSFEDLKDWELEIGTLQEYASVLYYEYRFRLASSSNHEIFNCNLKDTPFSEINFVFEKTNDTLVNLEPFRNDVLDDLYEKNITERGRIRLGILEDKLNLLNDEFHSVYTKHLYELVGLKNPLNFKYYTHSLLRRVYDSIDMIHDKQREVERLNKDLEENFGYLGSSEKIKNSFLDEIKHLNSSIDLELKESED